MWEWIVVIIGLIFSAAILIWMVYCWYQGFKYMTAKCRFCGKKLESPDEKTKFICWNCQQKDN